MPRCHLANRLHFDIAPDEDQDPTLCQTILNAGRAVLFLKRNQLVPWETQTKAEGCLADAASRGCTVSGCAPPALVS